MVNKLKYFVIRYRLPLGIAIIVLASASIFFAIRKWRRQGAEGRTTPVSQVVSTGSSVESVIETEAPPLVIRLSEGKPQPQALEPLPVPTGEPLPVEQIDAILARLPELPGEAETQADFKLAVEPIPPSRPGETVEEPFPPPPQVVPISTAEAGPLEVLRYAPQGEIPTAPMVSVTFNQAMVPLGTLEDLAGMDVDAAPDDGRGQQPRRTALELSGSAAESPRWPSCPARAFIRSGCPDAGSPTI